MKFSYNWLKEFVPKLPKPAALAELLSMHAFEVEAVEKHGKDYMLDVKIPPNRMADASGHAGLAEDIAAIARLSYKPKPPTIRESREHIKGVVRIQVKTPLCTRYMARIVRGVKVGPSPKWLTDRLEVCGIRSINTIVDATNYVMLETGQPLHAFDLKKISSQEIIVRMARAGEKIHALDDKTYVLDDTMMVIADSTEALAIAGIKGGTAAEITAHTRDIVIEAATFDGPAIRAASQKLRLKTDASARYSALMDANLAADAMAYVAALVQKLAGGEVLKGALDIYPKHVLPRRIGVRMDYVRSLLGENIKDTDAFAILKRLGFGVTRAQEAVAVTVPTRRVDVRLEEDIAEEIGRIYGYEHIRPKHPVGELVPPETDLAHVWEDETKDILAGLGFREAYNYSFIGEKEITLYSEYPRDYFELENPTRTEFAYLRRYLMPGLLRNARENIKHEGEVRMFEIGRTFHTSNSKEGYSEKNSLGVVIADRTNVKDANLFYELKGALSAYFEKMGVEVWFDDAEAVDAHSPYHPFRRATMRAGDEMIGVLGEVHPIVLEQFGIKTAVAACEIDFDTLTRYISKEKEFQVISRYPSVMRDVAILVPLHTKVDEVADVLENTGGELLIDSDLFDIYEGEELPDGKQSLAFHLVFQAPDRTLKDNEVDAVMENITKALETNLEWEVR